MKKNDKTLQCQPRTEIKVTGCLEFMGGYGICSKCQSDRVLTLVWPVILDSLPKYRCIPTCLSDEFLDEEDNCLKCANLIKGKRGCVRCQYNISTLVLVCLQCQPSLLPMIIDTNTNSLECKDQCQNNQKYDLLGNNCRLCSAIQEKCLQCTHFKDSCDKCEDGFHVNPANTSPQCLKCHESCVSCSKGEPVNKNGFCDTCVQGFILQPGKKECRAQE